MKDRAQAAAAEPGLRVNGHPPARYRVTAESVDAPPNRAVARALSTSAVRERAACAVGRNFIPCTTSERRRSNIGGRGALLSTSVPAHHSHRQ
ncbi:hypothetical protein [Rhodococcus erythropolis]|uniref:hypothetical protein n=1 Tax=Rhodococcus erythropolis TaxID=1833 RepID=UPI00130EAF1C|nr:hypothetical protein [Rhodococcus erythropolis]